MPEHYSSAQLVMREAGRRGIDMHSYEHIERGFARLVFGNHHEYIYQAQSDKVGRVSARIFTTNKFLTSTILKEIGFPTPADIITSDIEEAKKFLQQYRCVVVKPLNLEGGRGVTPGIKTDSGLEAAFAYANEYNDDPQKRLVCQQHIEGSNVRILVVGQDKCFALERIPAQVTGDGQHTISQLIDTYNQHSGERHSIKVDSQTVSILLGQGLSLEAIPQGGQVVPLALVANAASGGTTRDITDSVSDKAKQISMQLAAHFNTPIVGIDFITPSIGKDPGSIIEVNAAPDITIHHYPTHGESRDIAKLLIDMLFPETAA